MGCHTHSRVGLRNSRIKGIVTFLVAGLVVVTAVLAVPIGVKKADASNFSKCSQYDDYDDWHVLSSYNISYVCYALLASQPEFLYFYIYMTQSTRSTMFNDGQGSWAAVLIDLNADNEWDIQIETADQTYPFNTGFVSADVFVNGRSSSCRADSFMDVPSGGRYVAFRVSHICLGLPASNWHWKGYVDYRANDSTGWDYSYGNKRNTGGLWVDYYDFIRATTTTTTTSTTTTTTTTTTTVPIPNAPSSVAVTALGADSVRVTWLDNSSGEQGFLIQRNDLPVPAGTTVASWPYKVAAHVTEWTVGGLAPGSQACFAVAAFGSSGASRFTDFACLNLVAATTTTAKASSSLSCDARWGRRSRTSVLLTISAGVSNAGKRITVEAFDGGRWVTLGMARVTANGEAGLNVKGAAAKLSGTYPIRATQGSRFICEGTVR